MRPAIFRQIATLDKNISDVNNPVVNNKENKKRNREIDVALLMFFKNTLLLKEFIQNPLDTANSIIKIHGDLPYSKDFPDIYKGINSEHTKTQAVQIGKEKIVAYIKKVGEEIVSKYKPLTELVREPLENIEKLIELVNITFDYSTMSRRLSQATETEHFTKFTITNIDKYVAPAGVEVSSSISLINFLRACNVVYTDIYNSVLSEVVKDLKTVSTDTMAKLSFITINNKYLGTNQFNKTKIVYDELDTPLAKIGEAKKDFFYRKYIVESFHQLPTEKGDESKLELFASLVVKTEKIKDEMVGLLNLIKNAYAELGKLEIGIDGVVDTIINDVVEPMSNMTITLEEYSTKLDDYRLVIQNLLSVYDNTIRHIELNDNVPSNVFHAVSTIYSMLDKVLIKSTMFKGVEKQPTVMNYDNTPKNKVM